MEGSAEVSSPNPDISGVKLKFQAALNVIKNLPKNGSYKPSPSMMLKFYSYYKQATEGPCRKPKPWAWDVINKAKWEAWSKLGNMSNNEAMEKYVDNLKLVMSEAPPISEDEIVETMPATENVQKFIQILGDFYEIVDLEPPDQFKKFNAPDSTTSPTFEGPNETGTFNPEFHFGKEDQCKVSIHFGDDNDQTQLDETFNEDEQASNSSEEEFCDTAEEVEMIDSSTTKACNATNDHSSTYWSLQANDSSKSEGLKNFDDHLQSSTVKGVPCETPHRVTAPEGSNREPARNPAYKNGSPSTSSPPCTDEESPGPQVEAHKQTEWAPSQLQQHHIALTRVSKTFSTLEALKELPRVHRHHVSSRDTDDSSFKRMLLKMWPFPGMGWKTVIFIISWPLFVMWIRAIAYRRRVKR